MPHVTTIYRRDELYERIWARPMREVAKEYGVSDVALANACRKLDVPRPSRGYWAKKAAGQEANPIPLPPRRKGQVAEFTVSKWVYPPAPPPTPQELDFRARPEFQPSPVDVPFKIEVSGTLERPHRLVAATSKALKKAKPERDGLCTPWGQPSLPMKVSPAQADRALRFLDALLKAVEKAGHRVRSSEGYQKPTCFLVDGAEVEFSMKERLTRGPHVPRPDDYWAGGTPPQWDLVPVGRLRFKIEYDKPYGTSQEWEDSAKEPLEARVNDVFRSILEAAPRAKARQAERKERERLRVEEDRRRWEQEERRRREKQHDDALMEQAQQWHRCKVLRQFIEAVRAEAVARQGQIEPGDPADAWLRRAEAAVGRLDPFSVLFASD
jgi:hypothetical protein